MSERGAPICILIVVYQYSLTVRFCMLGGLIELVWLLSDGPVFWNPSLQKDDFLCLMIHRHMPSSKRSTFDSVL